MGRPLRGARLAAFYPETDSSNVPSLASLDSAFQLQEYIATLVRADTHDVARIVQVPEGGVDEACWIYEQLRRLAQDLTHPLITTLLQECTRQTCPEMKAGEWLYLCVAHGNSGAMEHCCAIDYIIHTLDSATALLNSPRAFPSRISIPPASHRHFPSLARRLGRIFAHAYYHHRLAFETAEAEGALYKRFLALSRRFELVPGEFLVIPEGSEGEKGDGRGEKGEGRESEKNEKNARGSPAPVPSPRRPRTDTMFLSAGGSPVPSPRRVSSPLARTLERGGEEPNTGVGERLTESERDKGDKKDATQPEPQSAPPSHLAPRKNSRGQVLSRDFAREPATRDGIFGTVRGGGAEAAHALKPPCTPEPDAPLAATSAVQEQVQTQPQPQPLSVAGSESPIPAYSALPEPGDVVFPIGETGHEEKEEPMGAPELDPIVGEPSAGRKGPGDVEMGVESAETEGDVAMVADGDAGEEKMPDDAGIEPVIDEMDEGNASEPAVETETETEMEIDDLIPSSADEEAALDPTSEATARESPLVPEADVEPSATPELDAEVAPAPEPEAAPPPETVTSETSSASDPVELPSSGVEGRQEDEKEAETETAQGTEGEGGKTADA